MSLGTVGSMTRKRRVKSAETNKGETRSETNLNRDVKLPPLFLTQRVTLEQVFAEYDFESCHPDFRADWERLLKTKVDGDELWRFEPTANEVKVWGIALVRTGKIISTLIEAVG